MSRSRLTALGLGCLVLLLIGSARTGVMDVDEARFSLGVKEMAAQGQWIVPTNWGKLRYQKPILAYWLAGISQDVLGLNPFALRLPSALCMVAAVMLTASATARRYGEALGLRAGWILATALLVVLQGHGFTADPALLLGTTVSYWAWAGLRDGAARPGRLRLAFWLGIAWGLLAKLVNVAFLAASGAASVFLDDRLPDGLRRGVVALVVLGTLAVAIPGLGALGPAVQVALFGGFALHSLGNADGRRAWRHTGLLWGAPLALVLVSLWALPALLATRGDFFTLGVRDDLLGRSTRAFEGHLGIPGYYLATTLVMFFPWGALLPRALLRAWRERAVDDRLPFLLAWILGPLVLLELTTTKLPHYMLVTFPALAVLAARELAWRERSAPAAARWWEVAIAAAPPIGLAIAAIALAVIFEPTSVRLAAIAFAVIALAVAVLLARRLRSADVSRWFPALAGGSVLLYVACFGLLFPALEPIRIARPIAQAVAAHLEPGERLILHDFRHASVGFALPVAPEVVRDPRDVAAALEDGPALLLIPNGEDNPRLDRIVETHPFAYERLETIRGHVLWRLRESEVWLVRPSSRD